MHWDPVLGCNLVHDSFLLLGISASLVLASVRYRREATAPVLQPNGRHRRLTKDITNYQLQPPLTLLAHKEHPPLPKDLLVPYFSRNVRIAMILHGETLKHGRSSSVP